MFSRLEKTLIPVSYTHLYDTWQDQGQGGDQGSLICTLEALKPYFPDITPDDVKLIQTDSKYCPNTGESAGSRSHYANGKASIVAAKNIADAMRKPDGTYRTYDEMVAEGIPTRYNGDWATAVSYTHLDVYKRQVETYLLRNCIRWSQLARESRKP